MLDAPGGGGGTPWESMTIDKMQELIRNPNTDKQWEIVDGWKKSADLILEHRFQVEGYKSNLMAAWPPDKSAASKAYVDRLDNLIAHLTETYEASLANYQAFSSATGAIYQAQVAMEKIYQEYKSNETLLTNFTAQQQQAKSSSTPTPSPSPSGEQPPVAPGRQAELQVQAAKMLSGVSTELAQAQLSIVKPALYSPLVLRNDKPHPSDDNPYVAPPIPPITTAFASDESTSTSSNRPSASFPTSNGSTGTTTVPGLTGNLSPITPAPTTSQPGLVLGGTQTPVPTPSNTGLSPLSPTLPGGTGGPISSTGLTPTTAFAPSTGTSGPLPRSTGIGRGSAGAREGVLRPNSSLPEGMRGLPEGMRGAPTNGVIGGTPGGLGQPGAGRAGTRRVNPVGGVIGEGAGGHGTSRGTGAGRVAGSGGMMGAEHGNGLYGGPNGGRKSGRREESDGTHWDPDNPWETAEGVDPVVLPSREQRIDPGPAIGLS
ncbi:hypothetical protein [Actinoplanes sp. NPDC026619]|uniref:hypothetical protein n=1 Tax=Actinoplanes sp. NPDC026619 TaxID=3155798 RepID=UPI0033FFC93F